MIAFARSGARATSRTYCAVVTPQLAKPESRIGKKTAVAACGSAHAERQAGQQYETTAADDGTARAPMVRRDAGDAGPDGARRRPAAPPPGRAGQSR